MGSWDGKPIELIPGVPKDAEGIRAAMMSLIQNGIGNGATQVKGMPVATQYDPGKMQGMNMLMGLSQDKRAYRAPGKIMAPQITGLGEQGFGWRKGQASAPAASAYGARNRPGPAGAGVAGPTGSGTTDVNRDPGPHGAEPDANPNAAQAGNDPQAKDPSVQERAGLSQAGQGMAYNPQTAYRIMSTIAANRRRPRGY